MMFMDPKKSKAPQPSPTFAWAMIFNMLKNSIKTNDMATFEPALTMSATKSYLAELLQTAIYYKHTNAVRMLIAQGCDLNNPPTSITRDIKNAFHESAIEYKPTPPIVYASCRGSMYAFVCVDF